MRNSYERRRKGKREEKIVTLQHNKKREGWEKGEKERNEKKL